MIYTSLDALKNFLHHNVCEAISLKKPNPDIAAGFELAHPVVTIGWPSGNLAGKAARQRIPGIAIGLADVAVDDGDYTRLPIELAFIVYAAGTVTADGKLEVDSSGYQDLVNLMDLTARHIRNITVDVPPLCLADQSISYSPENEVAGDYWLGHMQFTLNAPAIPLLAEKLLN